MSALGTGPSPGTPGIWHVRHLVISRPVLGSHRPQHRVPSALNASWTLQCHNLPHSGPLRRLSPLHASRSSCPDRTSPTILRPAAEPVTGFVSSIDAFAFRGTAGHEYPGVPNAQGLDLTVTAFNTAIVYHSARVVIQSWPSLGHARPASGACSSSMRPAEPPRPPLACRRTLCAGGAVSWLFVPG